jgi:adenine-specific DNA-methyltransferase
VGEKQLRYKRFATDFGYTEVTNWWDEFGGATNPIYVVQTNVEVVKRCILLTTDPGDLVFDPTCGSGTTAYVAEQWGRRWITVDTSRVPMALARQRLLTATFPWYALNDDQRGPAGGFIYKRKQNNKGEESGGIVPHIISSTIANDEPAKEEILVDRPESDSKITRVAGPFCVEATIPTPVDWEAGGIEDSGASQETYGSFVERLLEVLRKSPVLRLEGNRTVNEAGRVCFWTGERRCKREACIRGGKGGECKKLFAPLHRRVCDPTACSDVDRKMRGSRWGPRDLCSGDAGPHDGGFAQEHALQSNF